MTRPHRQAVRGSLTRPRPPRWISEGRLLGLAVLIGLLACDRERGSDQERPTNTRALPFNADAGGCEGTVLSTGRAVTAVNAGLEYCEGVFRRVEPVTCSPQATITACPADGEGGCSDDTDCTARARGRCSHGNGRSSSCQCIYPCDSDDQCRIDEACLCPAGVPADDGILLAALSVSSCVPSDCHSDADCPGGHCTLSIECCGTNAGFHCTRPKDECQTDADCPQGDECMYDQEHRRWNCQADCICE